MYAFLKEIDMRNDRQRPSRAWDMWFNAKRFCYKYRLVILVAVLLAVAGVAMAEHRKPVEPALAKLVKGHVVLGIGTCKVDKNNDLTKQNEVGVVFCTITMKPSDPDNLYVMTGDEQHAECLVKWNPKTMKQTVLYGKKPKPQPVGKQVTV